MNAERRSPRGRGVILAVAFVLGCGAARGAEVEYLARADWPRVRSAESVIALPALKRTVMRFDEQENAGIVIRYPGGDLGNAWAFEVRDWLISLGVASRHIVLEPGSGAADVLAIEVVDALSR